MRERRTRLTILAVLALGAVLQAGAFVQKAYACEPMRRSYEERPKCCKTGGLTRWTEEGGDCCVRLVVENADPSLRSASSEPVGAAGWTILPAPSVRLPAPMAVPTADWQALERGPPLPVPTETVVLLN